MHRQVAQELLAELRLDKFPLPESKDLYRCLLALPVLHGMGSPSMFVRNANSFLEDCDRKDRVFLYTALNACLITAGAKRMTLPSEWWYILDALHKSLGTNGTIGNFHFTDNEWWRVPAFVRLWRKQAEAIAKKDLEDRKVYKWKLGGFVFDWHYNNNSFLVGIFANEKDWEKSNDKDKGWFPPSIYFVARPDKSLNKLRYKEITKEARDRWCELNAVGWSEIHESVVDIDYWGYELKNRT